ncbi:hypothetical protein Cni_G10590 [Canna indica]|uniref:ATP-dependent DNA helicase n=1 Tax=Canna indica TaxID=4628 RepID=A0AAQ3KA57_9LILI|nr:hypothetical protein Cni_G10590 [Canna indica]
MSLKQRAIKAEYLGSTQSDKTVQSSAESGVYNVLYMTPEKACALPSRFWVNLLKVGICLLAVDEAHCISEWGHDFRKEFKQLNMLRGVLLDVPFVALTATATERVRYDIMCSLNMNDPFIAIGSFDRQNLFYGVKPFRRSLSFVEELVQEVSEYINNAGSTIIYCTTVKDTEEIHESLWSAGIKAGIYHGQMGSSDREKAHRSFIRDELQIMVATIAFGMGIDKPNIRCVIHYGCPKSLESYYQESGRCGRDGLPSVCWLYYSRKDFTKADFYFGDTQSENQRKAIMESLIAAEKYCFLTTCRRKFLLQYFGEKSADDCGNCDNCTQAKKQRDLSRECFLLLSCIRSCGGRWGINMHVDILRGSRSKKVIENNFDKLPMHGLGKDFSLNWWKAFATQLIAHGFLKENIVDVYRTISVSPMGMQFLSSANAEQPTPLVLSLTTEMVDEEVHGHQQKKVGDLSKAATLACEGFSEAFSLSFLKLYDNVFLCNRYAICGDETIKRLTKLRPSTKARLANMDGINQHFVTSYGDEFLNGINQLSREMNLPVDSEGTVQTAIAKKVYPNLEKNLPPAKHDAWRLWQHAEISIQEIAKMGKSHPIKEQTVTSYIIDAGRHGCELNWPRLCKETGLTLEIATQIHSAIAKVGSRDRLKPIKDELPESVSYDNIKAFLTMEELGLSAIEILSCNSTSEVPKRTKESSSDLPADNKDQQNWKTTAASHCPGSITASGASPSSPCGGTHVKQCRSSDSLQQECSPRKLQKVCEDKENCISDLVATENTVLEWIRNQDGVSAMDVVKQFKGSKEESVLDLLTSLEGDFLVFKKNDLYRIM